MNTRVIRNDCKLWITGPSGAGKSYLVGSVRKRDLEPKPITFDLDFLGYRRPGEDWKKWHINKGAFKLLSANAVQARASVIVVGCDSDPDGVLRAALDEGFEPVVLLPSLTELTSYRRQRGDQAAKIASSERDLASWAAHAERWKAYVASSGQEILSKWKV